MAWISVALFLFSFILTRRDANGGSSFGTHPGRLRRFLTGYVFGVSFSVFNFLWLWQFVSRWTGSSLLGFIPWVLVVLAFSVYYGLLGLVLGKAWQRKEEWMIPVLWAGSEVLRSTVPYLYFPWALLGTSLYKNSGLLQPAYWGGIFFLSGWMVLGALALTVLFMQGLGKKFWIYGSLFLAMGLSSWLSVPSETPSDQDHKNLVKVGALQPGVDLAFGEPSAVERTLWRNIEILLQEARKQGCEWVVLPEGLGVATQSEEAPFSAWGNKAPPVSLILGAQRWEGGDAFQSAFAYSAPPQGKESWAHIDKVRLVIFGEYVPFREHLPFLSAFRLPSGDLKPGERIGTLDVGKYRVGALLCFEALFEEVARVQARQGAQALVVLSLDDWYQGTGAVEMLKSASVLRAVENRLAVVRSAPLGVTIIVDP
ncbi:MAG: apolipoprotein N-acyltransferase, partial [Candidatus Caldarchaeum sp.]